MRLQNYLLFEKISQKDIKEGLDNDNIYVGAEFEFICFRMIENQNIQDVYKMAYDDWKTWLDQYDNYLDTIKKYNKDISDQKGELERLESIIDDLESKLSNMDDNDDDYQKLQDEISDRKEEYDNEKEELKNLERLLVDTKYFDVPEIGRDYIRYMEDYINWNEYFDQEDGYAEPPDPDSDFSENEWIERAESILPPLISDLEHVKDWEIGGYGKVVQGDYKWAFEYDPSLSKGGVEMKSPPMKISEFIKILPDVFNWIKEVGTVDESCGIHIHMSIDGIKNISKKLDMVKLIMFTEEEYIWRMFPERKGSRYAKSVKNKIEKDLGSDPKTFSKTIKSIFDPSLMRESLMRELLGSHYDAIRAVGKRGDHVEFRYIGGKDYHKKEKEIRSIIGKYAYTLSLAADPNFHYKEYTQKMVRAVNKLKKWRDMEKYEYYEMLSGLNKKQLEDLYWLGLDIHDDKQVFMFKQFVSKQMKKLKNNINKNSVRMSENDKWEIGVTMDFDEARNEVRSEILQKMKQRSN